MSRTIELLARDVRMANTMLAFSFGCWHIDWVLFDSNIGTLRSGRLKNNSKQKEIERFSCALDEATVFVSTHEMTIAAYKFLENMRSCHARSACFTLRFGQIIDLNQIAHRLYGQFSCAHGDATVAWMCHRSGCGQLNTAFGFAEFCVAIANQELDRMSLEKLFVYPYKNAEDGTWRLPSPGEAVCKKLQEFGVEFCYVSHDFCCWKLPEEWMVTVTHEHDRCN